MKTFLVILVALTLGGPALPVLAGSDSSAGATGAAFLKIGPGARPAALCGAYTAEADGAFSLFWNPAGLGRVRGRGAAAFSHSARTGVSESQSGAIAFSAKDWNSVLAIGFTRLGTSQEGYDLNGAKSGGFSTNDMAVSVGAGRRFELFPMRNYRAERTVLAGLAAKLISQRVPGASSLGFALDGGLQATIKETGKGAWTMGVAVLNLGPRQGLGKDKLPLPVAARIGTAFRHDPTRLLAALDLEGPAAGWAAPKLGLEWRPTDFAAFRAGYDFSKPAQGPLDALSFGAGFSWKAVSFSGAFNKHGELGDAMQLDCAVKW